MNLRCVLVVLLAVLVTCQALRFAYQRPNQRRRSIRPPPRPRGCSNKQFRCNNSNCIRRSQKCDGIDNCGDGSDESSCPRRPPLPRPEATNGPCSLTRCSRGQTCRLISSQNCGRQPCKPVATCINNEDRRPDISVCRTGKPILKEDYSTLTCDLRDPSACPALAFCQIDVTDVPSVCCLRSISAATPEPPRRKPGSCPRLFDGVGASCDRECTDDFKCPRDEKCCFNGCGQSCFSARLPTFPPVTNRNKPGDCPRIQDALGAICVSGCQDDSSCPFDQKCCYNGCGRVCTSAGPTTTTFRPGCRRGEFSCDNGQCISQRQKCNRQDDCGDNSDERNCRRNFGYGK